MNLVRRQLTALLMTEVKLVGRNTAVLATATLFPVGMAVFLVMFGKENLGPLGWALPVTIQIALICGMTTYITTTLTLTARREDLYLKRLRTSECSDATILAGLSSPTLLLGFAQCLLTVVIVWVLGPAGPANLALLLLAIVLTVALCTVAAVATTGLVSTTQQADMAAMPFFLFILATAIWAGTFGAAGPDIVPLVLPGGALMELISVAYNSTSGLSEQFASALPALGVMAGWLVLGSYAAQRLFRWDRRV